MSDMADEDIELAARTNNALERYNRHFNGKFSTKHPNLLSFAKVINEELDVQIQRVKNLRKRRKPRVEHEKVEFLEIPQAYNDYEAVLIPPPEKPATKKTKRKKRRESADKKPTKKVATRKSKRTKN